MESGVAMGLHDDLDQLITEARSAATADLDLRSTLDLVDLMNQEDATVPAAVGTASAQIGALVDRIAERLARSGRLVYVGAGSSGRLAALDAAECEATFSAAPGQVIALTSEATAGVTIDQAAEDDAEAGVAGVRAIGISHADAVVGISASGRTPYVLGALEAAAAAGALTACVVSTPNSPLARVVDHEIAVIVGPEVLSGSTRLKAGTAQKLVLNTISTVTMIRLGKTFGDLMVDVQATNDKLRARVRRIVAVATGAPAADVDDALDAAGGDAKVAIVSLLAAVDAETARGRLADTGGNVRLALLS